MFYPNCMKSPATFSATRAAAAVKGDGYRIPRKMARVILRSLRRCPSQHVFAASNKKRCLTEYSAVKGCTTAPRRSKGLGLRCVNVGRCDFPVLVCCIELVVVSGQHASDVEVLNITHNKMSPLWDINCQSNRLASHVWQHRGLQGPYSIHVPPQRPHATSVKYAGYKVEHYLTRTPTQWVHCFQIVFDKRRPIPHQEHVVRKTHLYLCGIREIWLYYGGK